MICDVVIPSRYVSGLHAYFILGRDGSWRLRDAHSTNGTFKNGERVPTGQAVPLYPGAPLRFGFLEVRFLDSIALHAYLRKH